MALPMVGPAPIVADHAAVFRDLFDNQRQFRHFQHYLTGLMDRLMATAHALGRGAERVPGLCEELDEEGHRAATHAISSQPHRGHTHQATPSRHNRIAISRPRSQAAQDPSGPGVSGGNMGSNVPSLAMIFLRGWPDGRRGVKAGAGAHDMSP